MHKRKRKAVFFANRTAKIRTLFIILQNFSEVFFNFSFYIVSQALLRKGKKVKKKNKPRFFANRTAKIRTLFNNIQNFPEVFLFLF